ncbi:hypothetical protein AN414_24565 [Serratia marcescens]|nr:hypothetical protein AN414_24565 [Serratia marcescens]
MGLEIGRIDHDGLVLCGFRHGQTFHHLDKYALVAPAFPAVIKRLRRAIFLRRITPTQPVAVDEDDAAQNASIINALAAMALGEIGLKTSHLLVRQPKQITHQSGSYTPI